MIERIGTAVGILVALGFPAPASAQDAPPLQRPPETTLSGSLRLEFAARDAAIEDLRSLLGGTTAAGRDDTFISADARLRLDVRIPRFRLAAELATLPYDDGENRPLAGDDIDVLLKQIYADFEEFPAEGLTLRAGAFEYAWKIRPHGESFLLDLGRAESFYTGAGDRDVVLPAGALLKWRAGDFVEVEAFWTTAIEGGPASADESAGGFLLNFPLSERSAFFLGALHVAGGGDERVTTLGGGGDAFFGQDREWEFFGEAWFQTGRIASGVSRRAWAGMAGTRFVEGPWRAELAATYRSGDDDPLDGRDGTFQSYEGQERFRIVESAEFGFDWDVNLASARLSLVRRLGESAEARIDAGLFRLAEATSGFDRDLGMEIDAAATFEWSRAASAWIGVAALFGSDTLESATPDGESNTLLATVGLKALW